jgi:hypothetical protein
MSFPENDHSGCNVYIILILKDFSLCATFFFHVIFLLSIWHFDCRDIDCKTFLILISYSIDVDSVLKRQAWFNVGDNRICLVFPL